MLDGIRSWSRARVVEEIVLREVLAGNALLNSVSPG